MNSSARELGQARDSAVKWGGQLYALIVLWLVYTFSSIDRFIISVLLEPIRKDFLLSDSALGVLAGAFAAFYVLAGIPLGWAVDRFNRRNLMAACLALWSLMTVLCGVAQNAIVLALGRIGVGIGEAGGGPAALSMVSDLYPPSERVFRVSLLYLAVPTGAMVAVGAGAWIAAEYGWRATFLLAGIPGLLLAILLLATVREPERGQWEAKSTIEAAPPLGATLRFIWSQRSLRHLLIGLGLTGFVSNGEIAWLTSFLIRQHDLPLKEAGLVLAVCLGPLAAAGIFIYGYITDKLARRDDRWRARIIALSCLGIVPFLFAALLLPHKSAVITALFAWFFLGAGIWGPAYALCQSLVGIRMRGVATSLTYVSIAAGALSPHVIGMLSDHLSIALGEQSLRYAMLAAALVAPWAVLHFFLSIRHVPADLQRAAARA